MEAYTAFRFILTVYFYIVVSISFIISFVLLSAEAVLLFPLLIIKPKLRLVILGQTHFALMELGRQRPDLPGSNERSIQDVLCLTHSSKMVVTVFYWCKNSNTQTTPSAAHGSSWSPLVPAYCGPLLRAAYVLCRPFWGKRVLRPLPSGISSKKIIVMVNHTSKVDPWVVGSVLLGTPTIYVVKRSLLKVPIAGWAQYLAGSLSVQFTKEKGGWGTEPGAVQEMMKDALKALSDGIWVVVFPEGTRSVTGRLQPFKNGFFRLAAENPDIHILPIALHNNFNLWPVTSALLYPGTSYIAAGDLIPARGLSTEQLRDKTHEAIHNLMKLSPEFDPLREQPLTELARVRGHGL
ncbi:hypothetical protein Efla_006520 [Eimeria flavescens]